MVCNACIHRVVLSSWILTVLSKGAWVPGIEVFMGIRTITYRYCDLPKCATAHVFFKYPNTNRSCCFQESPDGTDIIKIDIPDCLFQKLNRNIMSKS